MSLKGFLNAINLTSYFVCSVTGSNHMYFLVNPGCNEKSEGTPENVDWEFAQKEIAQAKGFATGFGSGLSKGNVRSCSIWINCFRLVGLVELFRVLLAEKPIFYWFGCSTFSTHIKLG